MSIANFMKRWSKKFLEVKLGQPKPEGCWPSCRRAFAKLISGIDFIMTPFQVTTDDEELAEDRQIQIDQLRATLAQKETIIGDLKETVQEKDENIEELEKAAQEKSENDADPKLHSF
ncbi:uncharacterized protein FMAN_01888 [Fusarium mangiferae]|uniref:Uncharacterized protein n=1 Tax=Fusarium mangiferae TaxID=192010 RepID=A0A1L7SF32_FUSMA|nr:uncharacterized protein FMAN_01888 [Fusarium mangiferae]CVK84965.1 uncharacterized protein FMAN_01888 [Fusarium mangiferae]